jgi:hypothetical protein
MNFQTNNIGTIIDIFNFTLINKYTKLLYLDTCVIVKGDVTKLFNIIEKDILYVLEEGNLLNDAEDFYGGNTIPYNEIIYDQTDMSGFTSKILLFNICEKISQLFKEIVKNKTTIKLQGIQQYIVYTAYKYQLYNNKLLKKYAVINDDNIDSEKILHYFVNSQFKREQFFKSIKTKTLFSTSQLVSKSSIPPNKNITFQIVALCISYNYYDTLQYMLVANYKHFEKIYIVTQEDDTVTINYCKQFNNIEVLMYDFTPTTDKTFDKYGAINYAQKLMYNAYPNYWYVMLDADIILPVNFIDILTNITLDEDCIYGGIRVDIKSINEICNMSFIINNKNKHNNIIREATTAPSILGCFQLYKKPVYHKVDFKNAGEGDFVFCHENFKLFCLLESILYYHLGDPNVEGINWDGKKEDFNSNILDNINNLYYISNIKSKIIYYNDLREIVTTIDNTYLLNDIANFFKIKLKLACIGSINDNQYIETLSQIFLKSYYIYTNTTINHMALDNISYIIHDIYNLSWDILPSDIQVLYLNTSTLANYTYSMCKWEILHSLKQFTQLQYIICSEYGTNPFIKKNIDQLLFKHILIFEAYIGVNHILQQNMTKKYAYEGIICSINKNMNLEIFLNTNKYTESLVNVFIQPSHPISRAGDNFPQVNKTSQRTKQRNN